MLLVPGTLKTLLVKGRIDHLLEVPIHVLFLGGFFVPRLRTLWGSTARISGLLWPMSGAFFFLVFGVLFIFF